MYIRKNVLMDVCVFIGFQGQDFDWADYLKQCEAEAAPQHCFPPVSLYSTYVCEY